MKFGRLEKLLVNEYLAAYILAISTAGSGRPGAVLSREFEML